EEKLVEIIENLLGEETIGMDDDFFALGGDSLKAIELISRVHKTFDVKIPLLEVFANPSIDSLARFVTGKQKQPGEFEALSPAEKREYYPLSSAQKRLYIVQNVDMQSTKYNISKVFNLTPATDTGKLEAIFRKLILRHDSLRTSFEEIEGEPVQKINCRFEFSISRQRVEKTGVQEALNAFKKPFTLTGAPLLRVGIIEAADSFELMIIDMHHIITDAVSMEILQQEFVALSAGKPLPPLKLQYTDYSQWQNSKTHKESLRKQENYWLNRFKGKFPKLEIPVDYPGKADTKADAGKHVFEIPAALTGKIKQICTKTGTTLY
ncbi:MAG: non-ribosomal peptide synthetase, partial [bacterium]|nr:non-ribosomal peptide synthetase [bacterium]